MKQELNLLLVLEKIKNNKRNWREHIEWMEEDRYLKLCPIGRRKQTTYNLEMKLEQV